VTYNLSRRIMGWMEDNQEPSTIAEIARACECSRETVRRLIRSLEAAGEVYVDGAEEPRRYLLRKPARLTAEQVAEAYRWADETMAALFKLEMLRQEPPA
jgi:DNA-binding IclR family transcriptional regulator